MSATAQATQAAIDAVASASPSAIPPSNFADALYYFLHGVGYTHPIHTVMTHMVIGPIIAAFLLSIIGYIFKKDKLFTTAKHLNYFAFAFWFVTVGVGIIDWIHYFSGASSDAISGKLAVAGILLFLIILAIFQNRAGREKSPITLGLYGLMTLCCVVLGMLGGDLVGFGENKKTASPTAVTFVKNADGYSEAKIEKFNFGFKRINDTQISLRLSAKADGWIAVGFGQTGTMKGSDIYLGYIDDKNIPVMEDHFGYDSQKHKPDIELGGTNNVTDIQGNFVDGTTTISWTIPLNSTEQTDIPLILGSTYKVIFAMGPKNSKNNEAYHGSSGYVITSFKFEEAAEAKASEAAKPSISPTPAPTK